MAVVTTAPQEPEPEVVPSSDPGPTADPGHPDPDHPPEDPDFLPL